ncbi:MAG: lysylphosphatidylglycerol synthase domain-containing protein [Phycisphaerae bacterium]|nr:lysylphosphatidylglycerol synthase domain-containing protein [Phycisphaerae bacterium]MDW8261515.1 lysylphosphatidylglycerol synthase domain-containing protein [Phycisphaerales bacterium]
METTSLAESAGSAVGRVLRWTLFILVLAAVGWALVRQFRAIDFSELHFSLMPVCVAIVMLVGVSVVQMISYRSLLAAYVDPPPWRAMAAVAWVPPLGKYVPGKVAALLGAIYMLRRFSVPAAVAVSVVLVLDGVAVLAGLICGAPLLLWEPVAQVLPGGWWYCGGLVLVGVLCLHPRVFDGLANSLLRRLRKPPLPKALGLKDYAVPLICAFSQWILAGLALWWMTRSVADVAVDRMGVFVSIAALAMTASYLALFAPGGLGVREGIYLATLSAVPGVGPKAAVVAALMRLAQTLVELGLAAAGALLLRGSMRLRQPEPTVDSPDPV